MIDEVIRILADAKYSFGESKAISVAIKSLQTTEKIDTLLSTTGMTETDCIDEIVEVLDEFNCFCEEVQNG